MIQEEEEVEEPATANPGAGDDASPTPIYEVVSNFGIGLENSATAQAASQASTAVVTEPATLGGLSGTVRAASTASGVLTGMGALSGTAAATSSASGKLTAVLADEAHATDEISATLSVASFPPERLAEAIGDIERISAEMKALAPLIAQLFAAQSDLGSNSGTMLAVGRRLTADDARILQLTGHILEREAALEAPHHDIVAQCLLVGRRLLESALNALLAIGTGLAINLSYDLLMHPVETHERIHDLVDTITSVFSFLF